MCACVGVCVRVVFSTSLSHACLCIHHHHDRSGEGVWVTFSEPQVSPRLCSGRLFHCKDPSSLWPLMTLTPSCQCLLLAMSDMSMVQFCSSSMCKRCTLDAQHSVPHSALSPMAPSVYLDTPQLSLLRTAEGCQHPTTLFTWIPGLFPDVVRSKAFHGQW